MAGAAAGVIDALWSWGAMSQFVGAGGKLAALVLTCATYALTGAILAPVVALVGAALYRVGYLGDLHRFTLAAPYRRLALAVAAPIPVIGVGLTMVAATGALAGRKHFGLVIASAMLAAILAVVLAAVVGLLVARTVELLLEGTRSGLLSRWWPPLVVLLVYLGVGVAVVNASAGETLALLGLRPVAVALLAAALAVPIWRRTAALPRRFGRLARPIRGGVIGVSVLALIAVIIACGDRAPARKAAIAHTGLTGPLIAALRTAADFDRDGYSRFLGGGDCDDWNSEVHPGAVEIPDDGIDNNCVGGDASTERDPSAAAFADPPAGLPADFNAVLITIDTLRADHLGAYGYERPTSPNLDRLAADGTLFANAWAHAPSTRYSIPAILTGRLPLAVDYFPIRNGWPGIAESNTTIAEVLASRGFTTGAILNYWYFEKRRMMDQGFAHYDNENRRLHRGVPGEGPAASRGSSSRQQTDKAIAYIDERAGKRFFLWVHYYDPHYEYERQPGTPDFGDQKIDRYDGEIHFTDRHVGRLLDHLRERGLYDKTVIAVTGDHGEGFGEHGVDLHGYHLYAAQTKVPLILKVAGATAKRVDTPVGHIDLLPTLANLAGAKPIPEMDGRSLVDLLTGARPPAEDRVVFQQLSYENNNEMRAAASRGCHVIFNLSPHLSWEIYAIDRDPDETRDVSSNPGDCAEVREKLERFVDHSEIPADAADALLDKRPAIDEPIDVDFGGEARLLAVDHPARVTRGESFALTLTWEARGKIRDPWKVFVHFNGPAKSFFQGDHTPARPLPWWRDGQVIRYTRQVVVPPRARIGKHEIWLGLFSGADRYPASSSRVRVTENRARVGEVIVE